MKGYGLCTRPIKSEPIKSEPLVDDSTSYKTDQLIDQAHSLIDMAKIFVTKPVNSKHSRKRSSTRSSKQGGEPKALDALHSMTVNNLSTLHVETDSTIRPSDSVPHTPKKLGKLSVKCALKYSLAYVN